MFTRGLRSLHLLPLVMLVAVCAVLLHQDSSGAQVAGFNACAKAQVVDTAPGASSNIKGNFGVGIGDDCTKGTPYPSGDDALSYNTAGLVNILPPGFTGPASPTDIPIGATIGVFNSIAQLGLLNNSCNTVLPVQFNGNPGNLGATKRVDQHRRYHFTQAGTVRRQAGTRPSGAALRGRQPSQRYP